MEEVPLLRRWECGNAVTKLVILFWVEMMRIGIGARCNDFLVVGPLRRHNGSTLTGGVK